MQQKRVPSPLPVATLFSSQAVLHDVEELLLGVDAELGVDGSAVGVGGVAGDVELGADEADVAAAGGSMLKTSVSRGVRPCSAAIWAQWPRLILMWHWQIKVKPGVVMSDRYMQYAILKCVFCESA